MDVSGRMQRGESQQNAVPVLIRKLINVQKKDVLKQRLKAKLHAHHVCHYQLLKLNVSKANVPMTSKRKLVPHVGQSQKKNHVMSKRDVHGNQERRAKRAHVIGRRER